MSDQPMSREDIENHCDVLAEVSIDWPVRVSLSRAIRDHDAALRVSLERCQDHQAHDTEEIVKLRAQLALKQHESQQVTAALHDDEVTTDPPLSVDVEDVRTLRAKVSQARDERNEFYNATVTLKGQVAKLEAENERLLENLSLCKGNELANQVDDLTAQLAASICDKQSVVQQLAAMTSERNEAVTVAKALTEPDPITKADVQWATEALSLKQQLAAMTLERNGAVERGKMVLKHSQEGWARLREIEKDRNDLQARVKELEQHIEEANAKYWEDHQYTDIKKIDALQARIADLEKVLHDIANGEYAEGKWVKVEEVARQALLPYKEA